MPCVTQASRSGFLKQTDNLNRNQAVDRRVSTRLSAGASAQTIAAFEEMFAAEERGLGWGPQQRWVEACYTLATDYAARGDKRKARETLETLLNLWKDADPDLPLLKKAKAEYAALQFSFNH